MGAQYSGIRNNLIHMYPLAARSVLTYEHCMILLPHTRERSAPLTVQV